MDYFRCHIFISTTECQSFFSDSSGCPSEITQLDILVLIKKKVFRLKITMQDIILVEVLESQDCLIEITEDFLRLEILSFMHIRIQVSIGGKVQDQIDIVVFLDVVVELDNVGMINFSMDSNLCSNIMKVRASSLGRVH